MFKIENTNARSGLGSTDAHKVRTSILIDRGILDRVKKLGLNFSQCCENALRLYIQAIESSNLQIIKNEVQKVDSGNSEALKLQESDKNGVVGRAGFEPATYFGLFLKKEDLNRDLESFRLFCVSKLNLSFETAKHYVRRVRAFLFGRERVSERDVQEYILRLKEEGYSSYYVSNVISAFKAYFRDYKGLSWMDGYKHPQAPLRVKDEISPEKVERFILAIEDVGVRCFALFLASSGLRKGEVLSLRKSDIIPELRAIIPNCHSGRTKRSGITFYNEEAEEALREFRKSMTRVQRESERLIPIGSDRLYREWMKAKLKSGVNLKPKDLRDFFSQEMGKALIPDRFIDIFQGRAPRSVLAKYYTPQGIRMLKEIYDKAGLKILKGIHESPEIKAKA